MIDDLPEFKKADSDGYAPDTPLDPAILRRIRKQLVRLHVDPDSCAYMERNGPGTAPAKLYSAVPRTIAYHPRRIPAQTKGVRVTVPLAAGPHEPGRVAGEARIGLRISGRVYWSEWQEVETTPDDGARPYIFEVDGLYVRRESWCEVMIVARTHVSGTIGQRRVFGGSAGLQPQEVNAGDPYGENAALSVYGSDDLYDVVAERGEAPSYDNTGKVTVYAATPYWGDGVKYADVHTLFWLAMPHGYQVDLIKSEDIGITNYSLRAGTIPRSDIGPGQLQRIAERVLRYPVTSSIGTTYPERPSTEWSRYPRWEHHYPVQGDYLTIRHAITPYNPSVRVRLNLAMIGQRTDRTTSVDSSGDLFEAAEECECEATLTVRHPANGAVASTAGSIKVACFPYDVSGHSPFLLERWLAEKSGDATDEWTWRDGQLYVGRAERGKDDLALISLQAVEVEIDADTFNAAGLSTEQTCYVELELGDFSGGRGTYSLTVLGSSVQQYILG